LELDAGIGGSPRVTEPGGRTEKKRCCDKARNQGNAVADAVGDLLFE